jgi:hypothetical protein
VLSSQAVAEGLGMCRKDAEDGWGHTSEVRRAQKKANGGPNRKLRLLASVAARDAWLFCPTSGPSVEQLRARMDTSGLADQHSRIRVRQAPARPTNRGPTPSSWIAFTAVVHPNRATRIIPLFSGNCAR